MGMMVGNRVKVFSIAVVALVLGVAVLRGALAQEPQVLPPLPMPRPAVPKEFRLEIDEGVVMDFVLIPAGTFIMGSPPNETGRGMDEGPRTRVIITRPFYMSRTEVTQLQYEMVMEDNPSEEEGGNYPVNSVRWAEAVEFCRRLTERERRARRLREDEEFRLPSEAEWERACRAGTDTRFSFGGVDAELAQHGWYQENSAEKPHVVGLMKPNPWGLFDMHGNVWEWCQDWYEPRYRGGEVKDPSGPETGQTKVMRGGSWADHATRCRSAARFSATPEFRSPMVGFRVVRTVGEPAVAIPLDAAD